MPSQKENDVFTRAWDDALALEGYACGANDDRCDRERACGGSHDDGGPLKVLVVAGSPAPSSISLVRRLAQEANFVVAVDRGTEVLHEADVIPTVYCGDEDSVSAEALAWVRASVRAMDVYAPEKDDTDLGLALALVREEARRRGSSVQVTLTCASGGRPDHALGVWGVLARFAALAPRVVEDAYECRILSREGVHSWRFCGEIGATVSAISLAPHTVASERGMRWELDHEELELLGDLGISNRVVAEEAEVRCHAGVLAAFKVYF